MLFRWVTKPDIIVTNKPRTTASNVISFECLPITCGVRATEIFKNVKSRVKLGIYRSCQLYLEWEGHLDKKRDMPPYMYLIVKVEF